MKELNQMKMKMKMIKYVNRIFLEWHKLESKEVASPSQKELSLAMVL